VKHADPRKLNVVGVFRSGTNYLRACLEWNYDCEVSYDAFGWKHGFLPVRSDGCDRGLVFITKDPFASLLSLHKYHGKVGRNLTAEGAWPAFLRARVLVFDAARPGSPQYRFQNPIQLWKDLNWNYHSASGGVHVRYADLLNDPGAALAPIEERFGLERTGETVDVPTRRMRRMDESDRPQRSDYVHRKRFRDRAYYLERKYMAEFQPEDIEFVLQNLDAELAGRLGYSALLGNR